MIDNLPCFKVSEYIIFEEFREFFIFNISADIDYIPWIIEGNRIDTDARRAESSTPLCPTSSLIDSLSLCDELISLESLLEDEAHPDKKCLE